MYALVFVLNSKEEYLLEYGDFDDCELQQKVLPELVYHNSEIVPAWETDEGNIEWMN